MKNNICNTKLCSSFPFHVVHTLSSLAFPVCPAPLVSFSAFARNGIVGHKGEEIKSQVFCFLLVESVLYWFCGPNVHGGCFTRVSNGLVQFCTFVSFLVFASKDECSSECVMQCLLQFSLNFPGHGCDLLIVVNWVSVCE